MRKSLVGILTLYTMIVWAGESTDPAWVNKSIVLNSTDHYQFFSRRIESTTSITVQYGQTPTIRESSNTSETHTVTFETKEEEIQVMYGSQLRVLDDAWSPKENWKILEDIADQIMKALDLSLQIRQEKIAERQRMDLLLNGKLIITIGLEPTKQEREYYFDRSFVWRKSVNVRDNK